MTGNVLLSSQMITPRKTSSHQKDSSPNFQFGEDDSLAVPLHPLRIQPSGNGYTAPQTIKQAAGLFANLPDESIIQVLEYLDATSLRWLGCACKALYAFSRVEELWKTLCVEYELLLSLFFLDLHYQTIHLVCCGRDLHCFGHHAALCLPGA